MSRSSVGRPARWVVLLQRRVGLVQVQVLGGRTAQHAGQLAVPAVAQRSQRGWVLLNDGA